MLKHAMVGGGWCVYTGVCKLQQRAVMNEVVKVDYKRETYASLRIPQQCWTTPGMATRSKILQ